MSLMRRLFTSRRSPKTVGGEERAPSGGAELEWTPTGALWRDPEFLVRLAQTIAWCASRADASDPRDSLRTHELNPSAADLYRDDSEEVVRTVVESRAQSVGTRPAVQREGLLDLHGGRLAVYFPAEQLDDGAAEFETDGFFDVQDTPPWDTWVGLYHDRVRGAYLISWVPEPLVVLAARGISANPIQCIAWLRLPDAARPTRSAYV
jgi:hypothetical protein